ncbi:hypothetical protein H257_02256 [Aphanomyces astaci]|uniref:Uncharacterized protein n=1 Tax=Aphanomyces astaci TaxID=112090 RepID=W4H3B7_APHAT|nr:hypothetical protein H257_02256 [Aphanomyces astaci]ETV85638.1 hypothetical protein H257_02256 [Aphanomyces astaci]|eukprot:XP_009824110.1 hypothetical protein H257_02256 [Aphanomyces astaci]
MFLSAVWHGLDGTTCVALREEAGPSNLPTIQQRPGKLEARPTLHDFRTHFLALWSGTLPLDHHPPHLVRPTTTPNTDDLQTSLLHGTQPPAAPWLLHSPNWTSHCTAQDNLTHQAWQLIRALTLRTLWNDRCAALHDNTSRIPPPVSFPYLLQAHFQALTTYHAQRRHRLRADLYHDLILRCSLFLVHPPLSSTRTDPNA